MTTQTQSQSTYNLSELVQYLNVTFNKGTVKEIINNAEQSLRQGNTCVNADQIDLQISTIYGVKDMRNLQASVVKTLVF